jgi:hypothetical protein
MLESLRSSPTRLFPIRIEDSHEDNCYYLSAGFLLAILGHGQTIVRAALAMATLLAMAALAIDIVTLYVAKGEVQRAADAVSLVASQSFCRFRCDQQPQQCQPAKRWPRT